MHTALSYSRRHLLLLPVAFASLLLMACAQSSVAPSSPSPVTPLERLSVVTPTSQAQALRLALTTTNSSGFSACLRDPQTSCVQASSLGRSALEVTGPTNLVGSVDGSTVALSWTAPQVVQVLDYIIDVRNGPNQPIVTTASSGGRTSFTATGVPAGTYYVSVRAQLSGGFTNPSNEVALTVASSSGGTCTAAPEAPSGLSGSGSGGTISLAWTAASGSPASYLVDAGSAPGLSNLATAVDVGAGTTMSAPNLPSGTYYVHVHAKNSCGTGPPSNEISVTVSGGAAPPGAVPGPTPGPEVCRTAPGAPIDLRASVSGTTITLTWTPPSGPVEGNMLDAGSTPGSIDITGNREIGVGPTMAAPDQPGGTYYIRIRAHNKCGTGPYSNEVLATVAGAPPGAGCTAAPGAPTNLQGSSPKAPDNSFGMTLETTLTWTAPAGRVDMYLLDAGSAPGLSDLESGKAIGTSTSFTAELREGTYYVRVRANNKCGTGPASNEVKLVAVDNKGTCTAAPPAPSGLRASVVLSTVTMSWTGVSGPLNSYVVEGGSAPGLADLGSRDVGKDTTAKEQIPAVGTFYLRVKARNNCGTSPASNEVAVTTAPPS